ncbi:hypothetical protein [Bradyrhizobium prioriisuperbiae]|uniref:hypothetical protein n=1 Tax=Bradyrhizobium prioriisuperbiae TaxID=2854389 RepID=UPI0028EF7995|nr:hypothetical protein [Bradyrhizobium prioritasuperba]
MKTLIIAIALMSLSPAWAQNKPVGVADTCRPIGRTEDGKLVYSMKCDNIPAAKTAATAAPQTPTPLPETEVDRGGLFGRAPSFIRPTNTGETPPTGAAPAVSR